jgi:SAM-dependent methyltransferase
LQNLIKNLTEDIHFTFIKANYERAKNLWDSCADIVLQSTNMLYLDIGTFLGYNASAFGFGADEIVALDIDLPPNNILKEVPNANLLLADGMKLPFIESKFDMISLFSVIEHVTNQRALMQEVFRVLKPQGILIVQIPNRLFPVELHSGIPFLLFLPKNIRKLILNSIGYGEMGGINIPSLKSLLSLVDEVETGTQITIKKVKYSPLTIPPKLRVIYTLFSKLGVLDFIPLGYIFLVKKCK